MGRANRPVRWLAARSVRVGDVVLIRPPEVSNSRWLLVDWVNPVSPGVAWSGRWVFGDDAGRWTAVRVAAERYTVKDRADAARDARRLEALPRNAHI